MSFISNIVLIIDGIVELVLFIICADILGIQNKKQIHKGRIIRSLMVYVLFSVLFLVLKNCFGNVGEFFSIYMYFFRFIPATYFLYKRINFRILYLVFLCDLSVYLVGASISNIVSNITEINLNIISSSIMLLIRAVILIVILIIGKRSNSHRNAAVLLTIPNHIYIMLILTLIYLSAMPSLITHKTDNAIIKENLMIAFIAILTVILICIIASLILNVLAKQHFTAVSQMMQEQVDLQIDHYKKFEKMNAEISKFRHDYTNHLQGILSLIQANEYSQAEDYILDLRNRINKVKSELHIFDTGNGLADALLSDKASALNENCKIEYNGIIPDSINKVDLCIILSNALDNAVEACNELPSPGVISIHAAKQQGYFVLSIKNPTTCTENYYDIPVTTKPDKEHHGMGLYNIDSTVKKNDGQMKIKCENGFFELTITMKIQT